MNLFFEESGSFKAGTVLSQTGESYQVETPSGKRIKVKAKDVHMQFGSPAPQQLLENAEEIADQIDIDFLWEVAGLEEFGFSDLALEYFGHPPLPAESAALLLKLHSSPIYFYKKGRGRYKAAPEASLKAALAGIEKKRQQALIQARYVEELKLGLLPAPIGAIALQLLFKPDKNGIEYKAVEEACHLLHTTPARLMLANRGVASPKELHLSRFLFERFPKGTHFPAITLPPVPTQLPVASVQAFSIDDVTTTEIDDAFSVTRLSDGQVRIGIHIAAPGLGIRPEDNIDNLARQRMSTVYMPGDKITMLPDDLVNAYTLRENATCPALSLYATLNEADWSVLSTETKIECVPIHRNLRHHEIEDLVTEETLADGSGDYPHKEDIALLWQWTLVLEKARMAKRESFGLRPEQNNRVDFNFYVENDTVRIVRRKRGAPLDKIVAELMIFANSSWGKLLHDHGVPGIYRTQTSSNGWGNKMQVKMTTHAAPHQGLGVDQYAWSTSPLRRYTDLVNQWQIITCVEHGITAPLVAAFKPKDARLFAIIAAFDATYTAYSEFQTTMERYWCLRWLQQEGIRQTDAVVLKEEVLRLLELPLIIRMPGLTNVARGAQVKLDLIGWDEVELNIEARVLEVAALASDGADLAIEDDEAEEAMDESSGPTVTPNAEATAEVLSESFPEEQKMGTA